MSSSGQEESVESTSKATEEKEKQGLTFFTANDDDSSSESESDDDNSANEKQATNGSTPDQAKHSTKLPSPSTVFATVGKPKFLERPLDEEGIDWHSLSKRYEPLYEYSSVSYPSKTVDLSSAERVEATISGAPVKYKQEISETKQHLFLHGKRSMDTSNTQEASSIAQGAQTSSKKQKPS